MLFAVIIMSSYVSFRPVLNVEFPFFSLLIFSVPLLILVYWRELCLDFAGYSLPLRYTKGIDKFLLRLDFKRFRPLGALLGGVNKHTQTHNFKLNFNSQLLNSIPIFIVYENAHMEA